MQPFIWIDLETTGLDPRDDVILEVGVAVTGKDCEIIGEPRNWVLWRSENALLESLDATVREMHTDNGLLDEVRESKLVDRKLLEEELCCYLMPFAGCPLAGSNPEFDRAFLKTYLPVAESMLHYRNFDMNSCYYFYGLKKERGLKLTHRALDDVRRDISKFQELHKKWIPQ